MKPEMWEDGDGGLREESLKNWRALHFCFFLFCIKIVNAHFVYAHKIEHFCGRFKKHLPTQEQIWHT